MFLNEKNKAHVIKAWALSFINGININNINKVSILYLIFI